MAPGRLVVIYSSLKKSGAADESDAKGQKNQSSEMVIATVSVPCPGLPRRFSRANGPCRRGVVNKQTVQSVCVWIR
jgi:hypothetical protein